ncbi:MAG TPA: hypothetical protein VF909_03230 [Roseiflexaceae bacterium]
MYAGLSAARRRLLHRRVASVLEVAYADDLDAISGQNAIHFERSGLPQQAIAYYQRAAGAAHRLSALEEAIDHLNRALALLKALPETSERTHQELALQIELGAPLLATRGYAAPEVEQTFNRARELCQQIGNTPQLFRVLWGLGRFYLVRPRLETARALGEQMLAMAERAEDPNLLLEAHNSLGAFMFHLGEPVAACAHLEQGSALYDRQRHGAHALIYGQDPGVVCLVRAAWALWILGYPDQAVERSRAALALAYEVAHPFSLAFALSYTAVLYYFRREPHAAQEYTQAAVPLSTEHGFPLFLAMAAIMRDWVLREGGALTKVDVQIRRDLATFRATGAELGVPYFLGLLAETEGQAGRIADGLSVLADALAVMEQTEERWCEADLFRVHGELLLQQDAAAIEAEAWFHRAIEVARRQRARSFELRATVSLSKLLRSRGRQAEARPMLAKIYTWFTEGFDTPDLIEARALLEVLSSEPR